MSDSELHQIIAFGDVFLKSKSGIFPPFSADIENLLKNVPSAIINLETVLVDIGQPTQKSVILRTDRAMANYLHEVGVTVVNLANNHSFDYGVDGFNSTLSALDEAGISYIGVKKQGQQKPFHQYFNDYHIGILGYTIGSHQNNKTCLAALNEEEIIKDIADLKSQNVRWIVINLHWGEEYIAYPSPDQQRIARHLIDYGAHVIIGHHPHVIQGIESYNNGIIFYSLGNCNFIHGKDLNSQNPGSNWGLAALISFTENGINYDCIPLQIDDEYRPNIAQHQEKQEILHHLSLISEPLKQGISQKFWLQEASIPYFRNHLPSFFQRIRKYGFYHFYLMIRWMINPKNYKYYYGLILIVWRNFKFSIRH